MDVPCVCINNSNKPGDIPQERWPILDEKYHITFVSYHPLQGLQGCLLRELELIDCGAYEFYKLNRFAFRLSDLPLMIELMKNCTELNDIDIQELIESKELIVQE